VHDVTEALVVRFTGSEYAMIRRGGQASMSGQWGAAVRCEAGWPRNCWVLVLAAPSGGGEGGGARAALWTKDRFWPRAAGEITVCRPLWRGMAVDAGVVGAGVLAGWAGVWV
jgi:hypothetical protein